MIHNYKCGDCLGQRVSNISTGISFGIFFLTALCQMCFSLIYAVSLDVFGTTAVYSFLSREKSHNVDLDTAGRLAEC
jgi:hypothetical protein